MGTPRIQTSVKPRPNMDPPPLSRAPRSTVADVYRLLTTPHVRWEAPTRISRRVVRGDERQTIRVVLMAADHDRLRGAGELGIPPTPGHVAGAYPGDGLARDVCSARRERVAPGVLPAHVDRRS